MKGKRASFTLIEIMVVVAIIGLLLGIVVPGFRRMMTGSGVNYAARMVSSQLNLARAEAATKRAYVAVLFLAHDAATLPVNQTLTEIVNLRAFRSCYVEKVGDDYKFDGWATDKWEMLPTGVFFPTSKFAASVDIQAVEDDADPAFFSFTAGTGRSFTRAILFKPTGRPVWDGSHPPQVAVMEGQIAENDQKDNTDELLKAVRSVNEDNFVTCKVNAYTGGVLTKQNQ